jgi:hypothetical protein
MEVTGEEVSSVLTSEPRESHTLLFDVLLDSFPWHKADGVGMALGKLVDVRMVSQSSAAD